MKQGLILLVLCIIGIVSYAQPGVSYDQRWRVVDSLIEKKGLTVTALGEVNKIYSLARKEKNEGQLIKALVYRIRLEERRSDEGLPAAIREMENQVDSSKGAARAILQNMLAGLYSVYLNANTWRISQRTEVRQKSDTDITTWSTIDLQRKIQGLYLRSLEPEETLTHIDIDAYRPIIHKGSQPQLRPTLWDLLAHNALDYFKLERAYEASAVHSFQLDAPVLYSDPVTFANYRFITSDSLNGHFQAVRLYQRLIRLHLPDPRPDALIEVDIERLNFVSMNAAQKDDPAYMQALQRIVERYPDSPEAANALYWQASVHFSRGIDANPSDSNGLVKARTICEKIIAQLPDSNEIKTSTIQLLHTILRKELEVQMEGVCMPGRPFPALVSWQNFSRLFMHVIRVDDDAAEKLMQQSIYDTGFLKRVLAMPVYRTHAWALPETHDLRRHSTEIAIGSLPPGAYILVTGSDSSWSRHQGVIGLQFFRVSAIAYIGRGKDYFVVNRETGKSIAGAKVQVLQTDYNRQREKPKVVASYTTDEDGHFLQKENDYLHGPTSFDISIPGDHLGPVRSGYYAFQTEESEVIKDQKIYEKTHVRSFLFSDRSIYRPGQPIYFKGIATTQDFDTHQPKPYSDHAVNVQLYNANNQLVDSMRLMTNEFGSYHGSFRLPENQLNGSFMLSDSLGGAMQFSVEEYKRPKFYVEYDKLQGSYRVGDSIRVTGTARGYAGNGIDGAKVNYHIVRETRFPYDWMFWETRLPHRGNQEVASGTATTDASGKFSFVFYALPDKDAERKYYPEFDFQINTDVTDINGETRSGTTDIVAGYTAIKLAVSLPAGDHLPSDSLRSIFLSASNLAGVPVKADVKVSIYPLQAPQRLIRERLWEAPDRYTLSEKEWLDSFPHDEYRQETKKESWPRGGQLWNTTEHLTAESKFDAAPDSVAISAGLLKPGFYVIEAKAVDSFGNEVKDRQYVELYDGKTGRPAAPEYSWEQGEVQSTAPGEKCVTSMGTSAEDAYIIRAVERGGQTRYSHFVLSNDQKQTDWAVTESDRGGFGVMDAFVKENRIYTHSSKIDVPWSNKELEIRYASFRDKTEPGSAEKWKMTISGHRGEKVSAEVLTAMYDASLDQFKPHGWTTPSLYPTYFPSSDWYAFSNFESITSQYRDFDPQPKYPSKNIPLYDELFQALDERRVVIGYGVRRNFGAAPMAIYKDADVAPEGLAMAHAIQVPDLKNDPDGSKGLMREEVEEAKATPPKIVAGADFNAPSSAMQVRPRSDFRETAFFFPDLRTDSAGSVSFSFTMPDALTTWKWMTLASTRDLAFGYSEKSVITQKKLMVQPNAPRFLREGDKMELQVKVVNMTDSELTGQMSLQLTDPTTGQTADGWFVNRQPNQYFTVEAHQSFVIGFPLDIPYQYNRPVNYRIVAQAGVFSDGEEATLPVVSNRMLVTETLPLNLSGDGTKHYTFEKLLQSGNSETLNHHAVTVEFTTNPAWYAVQSLPYLAEYPHACAEQTFERAYANALASKIAMSSPRLRRVFEQWRTEDTTALLSNLQKNQELKSVLLEETPWVLQGKTEAEQRKNIALLFDMNKMSSSLGSALDMLKDMQSANGAFPWFKGGGDDRYITQYIVTGIAHLQKLQAIPDDQNGKLNAIVAAALPYLDGQIKKDYETAKASEKQAGKTLTNQIGSLQIQYLYMRSFFLKDFPLPGDVLPAMTYFRKKAQEGWVDRSKYLQGMIAQALYQTGDGKTAWDILASLRQNAIHDPEKGMYWKGMEGGYFWYEAPVETQSLLIETFHAISGDAGIDRELKTWLLRQKQTHSWPTTTATADACYALLLGAGDWLNAERSVDVRLGNKNVTMASDSALGYSKKIFDGPFVNADMGNITVTMKTKGGGGSPAWGAVYWQYFDMLDRITPPGGAKQVLSITKKLYIKRNSDRGPVLDTLADNATLHVGDRVVVRMIVRADRDLEYVHVKDMRAACLEPEQVLSGYKWQDGLGYYATTRDASTDLFFSRLPRGTHVFEYSLLAGQTGNFSNGVTTIECMYAPEFAYHSEGIRVNVEAAP